MCWSTKAVIKNKNKKHRLGGQSNRNLFLTVLEPGNFKVNMSANFAPQRGLSYLPFSLYEENSGLYLLIKVVISHPSTNQARPCLASKIRRDPARSGWYGHRHVNTWLIHVNV